MGEYKDITGQRFGRLVAEKRVGFVQYCDGKASIWLCLCDCGERTKVHLGNLKRNTKSCGCLQREKIRSMHLTHGLSRTKIIRAYEKARGRCENKKDFRYKEYGARGIKMHWEDAEGFLRDMKKSFDEHIKEFGIKDTTLDRIDVNGNYCKENCRWATWKEQQNNRRTTRLITINNKTQSLTKWIEELKISRSTVENRLYRKGWAAEKALLIPKTK